MSIPSTGLSRHERSDALPGHGNYAFRINDACRLLGIGRTTLYGLARSGQLKLIKIAGRSLVPRSEIERLTQVDSAD